MIEPMKKLHILLAAKSLHEDIEGLQNLGLVDVHSVGSVDADSSLARRHVRVRTALNYLDALNDDCVIDSESRKSRDADELAQNINEIAVEIQEIEKETEQMQDTYSIAERFGGMSMRTVQEFRHKGIEFLVYKAPAVAKHPHSMRKRKSKIAVTHVEGDDKGYTHTRCIWRGNEESYWMVFSYHGGEIKIPSEWTPMQVPALSHKEIEKQLEDSRAKLSDLQTLLASYGYAKQILLVESTDLSNKLSQEAVIRGARDEQELVVIEGYAPERVLYELYSEATDKRWGIMVTDVAPDDESVPTKIKNIAPVRIVKPLFDFLDVDAGYNEFDIGFIFLTFMSLFVGMIIGDGGYGLVLFTFSAWAMFSARVKGKRITLVHILFLWFSITTIAWGVITGNWFGYKPLARVPFLSMLIIPQFSILSPQSSEAIQLFAFRVGIIHLLIAHLWRGIRDLRTEGFLSFLHQVGQATMLVGLFYLVVQLLLGADRFPMPSFTINLIIIGFVLIVLTSEQKRGQNIFLGMGKGAANFITLALNSIGAFADIISYIRLYAVGLASFSIAESFNDMATGLMESGGAGAIAGGVAVLVFGHTLNLIMAVLAVVVHGVRLNVLEFSGHLGMEWTGRKYNPFKKKLITRRT